MITITHNAREVLRSTATVCDGNALTISGQLAPGEYAEVKRVLEAAGAKWNKRAQAHLFTGCAATALSSLLAGDRVVSATEADQWFPTPPAVVARLMDRAALEDGMVVLEPSAGEGAIAEAIVRQGCLVDCIEMNPARAATLEAASIGARAVTLADFLAVLPRATYDRVIMNPPFAKLADARHVLHALKFVKPGGLLVSVMGSGVTFRTDRASARIREMAGQPGGSIEALPDGSFRDAGAGVSTVIVVLPVPGKAGPVKAASGEPVRVTTDRTATGASLFDPATAKPGVYVRYDAWAGADAVFRFAGDCIGCGARTWRHDHGGDDVRGPFGDHTGMPLDVEDLEGNGVDVPEGTTFPRCAVCWNEADRYRVAIDRAIRKLKAAARPVKLPEHPVLVTAQGLW
jgi:predicted RNA methylase